MYKNFRPGKIWYDNNGKRIHAHGGSILFAENKFGGMEKTKKGLRVWLHTCGCPFVLIKTTNRIYVGNVFGV